MAVRPMASVLAGTLLLGLASSAAADAAGPPTIRVTGEASISAPPDRASVQVSVVTEAKTARDAAEANAEKSDAVLAAVRKIAGKKAEIGTVGYTLSPQYAYEEGQAPRITGYRAANAVRVKTPDLSGIGEVIDAAMRAGANEIERLEFLLEEDAEVRARALRRAVADARGEADVVAQALGTKVRRVRSVEVHGGGAPPPVPMHAEAMVMSARSTPIEAGPTQVEARVGLVVELGE